MCSACFSGNDPHEKPPACRLVWWCSPAVMVLYEHGRAACTPAQVYRRHLLCCLLVIVIVKKKVVSPVVCLEGRT